MVKNYLQIDTGAVLIVGKGDKPVTFTIDGVNYTGTVKAAMEIVDVGVAAGTREGKWVVDATGKLAKITVDI
jgi:hypothetical protein